MNHTNCILSLEGDLEVIRKELSELDHKVYADKVNLLKHLENEIKSGIRILQFIDELNR